MPKVYFLGAGPGDPELLTLKAHRILNLADTVVYADSLVPTQMLQNTRVDALKVPTGHKTLEQILPLMIEQVRQGRSVVRLHSGDLTLYSAIHEQIMVLREANVAYELVPGISAFQAAAARLGAELTVPELVQTIILTRIGGRASPVPDTERLAALASHRASLGLYLAARHVAQAQTELLLHYPSETPVAVCFRVGWPDEKIWVVPLSEIAELTRREQLVRTTLYLVSPALDAAELDLRSRLYDPEHTHLFRPRRKLTSDSSYSPLSAGTAG